MTKREAKKYVITIIKQQLASDIDNGSEWLHDGFDSVLGEPRFNEQDQARVLAVVREFIDADTIIAKRDQP